MALLYLTSQTAPAAPAFAAGWEQTAGAATGLLGTLPGGDNTAVTVAETVTSATHDVALGQWVSPPMVRAGSVAGDFVSIVARNESAAAADLVTRIIIRVVSGDGATVRGTAFDNVYATEWTTTLSGRTSAGTMAAVAAQVGDRLVIEYGYRATNAASTSYSGTIRYGGAGALQLSDVAPAAETRCPRIDVPQAVYDLFAGMPLHPATSPGAWLAVEVAFGADLTDDETEWPWAEITADVRQAPGIAAELGRADEASTTQPARCSLVLDNSDGAYSLGGESVNYPNVRRGTPVRVRVDPDGAGALVVAQGNAVGWTPAWRPGDTAPSVRLEAAGTLRRLMQGDAPVVSPIRRALLIRDDVIAYWPCEEGAKAGAFAAAVGASDMAYSGEPDLATSEAFDCSAPLPVLKGSTWTGAVPPYTATGAVQVRALVDFPTSDEPTGAVVLRVYTSGSAARWDLIYETGFGGLLSLTIYDRFGTQIGDTVGVDFNVNEAPTARRWSLEMVQDGADIDYRWSTVDAGAAGAGYYTGTLAAYTIGAAVLVQVNPDGALDGVAVGHVSVQDAQTSLFDDRAQLNAYDGEYATGAAQRLERVCLQNDIPLEVHTESGGLETMSSLADQLGPQPRGTVLDVLRDAELAEQGVLYDGRSAGLDYATRRYRENRAADLTIDAAAGELAEPFEPVDDDQRTRNRVQVTRTRGRAAVVEDTDGPLGTAAIGLYDTSETVNTWRDEGAKLYAGWFVALGTLEGYRYPALSVDLRAHPALARAVLGLLPGMRVDVTGLDAVLPGHPAGTVSVIVEGVAVQITAAAWRVVLRCSPYEPWRVALAAADSGDTDEHVGRADTDGATVDTAAADGATSLAVATTSGPLWSTVADDYPLTLEVGGLAVTATACSGASSPQTFTVDPLPAARAAGLTVRLYRPPRLGL